MGVGMLQTQACHGALIAPLAMTSPRAINANPIIVEARAACGNSFSADTVSVSKSIQAMLIVPAATNTPKRAQQHPRQ